MPRTLAELEKEVLQLPERDRATLAEHLLGSLEPGEDIDAENLWLEEAERRYQAYRRGEIASRPANEVIQEARKKTGLKPAVLLGPAEEELVEAARFYEGRHTGLGSDFLAELEHSITRVQENPGAGMHLRRRPNYWRNR